VTCKQATRESETQRPTGGLMTPPSAAARKTSVRVFHMDTCSNLEGANSLVSTSDQVFTPSLPGKNNRQKSNPSSAEIDCKSATVKSDLRSGHLTISDPLDHLFHHLQIAPAKRNIRPVDSWVVSSCHQSHSESRTLASSPPGR
jgi:hypothetical protein